MALKGEMHLKPNAIPAVKIFPEADKITARTSVSSATFWKHAFISLNLQGVEIIQKVFLNIKQMFQR